jgi:hypothetical protein
VRNSNPLCSAIDLPAQTITFGIKLSHVALKGHFIYVLLQQRHGDCSIVWLSVTFKERVKINIPEIETTINCPHVTSLFPPMLKKLRQEDPRRIINIINITMVFKKLTYTSNNRTSNNK